MDPEEIQAQEQLNYLITENCIDEMDLYNDIEYYDDCAYGIGEQADFS
jgi:hypothetical protein